MPEPQDAETIRRVLSSFVECECAYGEESKENCPRHGSIRALDRLTGSTYLHWADGVKGYTLPTLNDPMVQTLQAFLDQHSKPLIDPYRRIICGDRG
jgi:hypothetical protein